MKFRETNGVANRDKRGLRVPEIKAECRETNGAAVAEVLLLRHVKTNRYVEP